MKRIFLIFLASLLMPEVSFADITLSGGEWSTTFNCPDWQDHAAPYTYMTCDGLSSNNGNNSCGQWSAVNASGNFSGGGGYKGWREYLCPGSLSNTSPLNISLASPVNEIWFRYYARYQAGFTWTGLQGQKLAYAWTDSPQWRTELMGNGISLLANDAGQSAIWHHPDHANCSCGGTHFSAYGWNDLNGGSSVSNGSWHSYETHLKRETSGCNGVFEQWIDGVLRNQHTGICFGHGFQTWGMGANQAIVGTGGFWDIDDFKISTNGYIGLVGVGGGGDTTAPTVPTGFSSTAVSASQINLTWTVSTDAVGVAGYNIYRNGSLIGTSATNSYSSTGLSPSTTYAYTVSAYDAAGNTSAQSSSVSATTTSAPSQSLLLSETFEAQNMNNWDDDWVAGTYSFVTTPVYEGSRSLRVSVTQAGNYVHFFGDHPGINNAQVTDFTSEEHIYFQSPFTWDGTGIHLWTLNAFESWSANYATAAGQSKPHAWAPYYITVGIVGSGELFMYLCRADGLPGASTGVIWQNYFQNQGATSYITPGAWNKVRYRAKLNTPGSSDGIFQLWLNDVLIIQYTNINYRANYTSYGWNHLMMRYDGTNMPSQYIYRDNVTLWNGTTGLIPNPITNIIIR
jgi:hypothetical protein